MSRRGVGRSFGGGVVLCALAAISGCDSAVEVAREYFRPPLFPHEEYRARLIESGLSGTAMGRDWVSAAASALDQAPPVETPFEEEGYLDPAEAGARGWRFSAERGQVIRVDVEWESESEGRVFLDLFEVPENAGALPRHRSSAEVVPNPAGGTEIEFEPRDDGDFLIRLQPEVLRGGAYRVTIRRQATLAFPVEGRGVGAIQSFFGAARDGGRRSHHGVDIFAPRGTPVLASTDGVVRRVEVTNLGGRVVWLNDSRRRQSLYYAHLDSQYVRSGQRVSEGDTLGFVGNSGNAITTPPHLHFGVYSRGPRDPLPALRRLPEDPPERTADPNAIGSWVRVREDGIRLREGAGRTTAVASTLDTEMPLLVRAVAGSWYRVELPDGGSGFVAARLTRSAVERPSGRMAVVDGTAVRTAPSPRAPSMARYADDAEVEVLGRYEGFALVEWSPGRTGWLATGPSVASTDLED